MNSYIDVKQPIDSVIVKKDELNLYIAQPYNKDYYAVQSMISHRPVSLSSNPNANLIEIRKVLKTAEDITGGDLLKTTGDDICPANIFDSYIGGNHGWAKVYVVTANNHGKTIADIGAKYSSGYIILRIVDENTLWMSQASNYPNTPPSVLSYTNNGNSTTDINVSSSTMLSNFYGSVCEAEYKLIGDEKELTENGIYYLKEFSLIEIYDVLDFPSIVNAVYNNRPSGGYSEQPVFQNLNGVEVLFTRSVSYKFTQDGTMLIGTSLLAKK